MVDLFLVSDSVMTVPYRTGGGVGDVRVRGPK